MQTAMKYIISFLLGLTVGCVVLFALMRDKPMHTPEVNETKEVVVDTLIYEAPTYDSERTIERVRYVFPAYKCAVDSGQCTVDSGQCAVDGVQVAIVGGGAGGQPRCSRDSAVMELPYIQRHYTDSAYEAWVSGPMDPRLDSIRVCLPTAIITKYQPAKPKRWHIGVTAGYGYGAKGFQPYVGIGLTYSILSFLIEPSN